VTATSLAATAPRPEAADRERPLAPIALVDLLDRLLGTGVVLAGDVVISLAGVDLVRVELHALITSVRADMERWGPRP
jgi:Gas vesicle protein